MRKVLFVVSGNSEYYEVAPFIRSQGDSLQKEGVEVSYFPVKGKGIKGYLKSIPQLRTHLKRNSFDLIHAHYSLCGWVAVLALGGLPIVLSLMGDDAQGDSVKKGKISFSSRVLILFAKIIQPLVQAIITKSPNLEKAVYRKSISHLIPNGVRLDQFSKNGIDYRQALGLNPIKKYVLFLAPPTDLNKNIKLVKDALQLMNRPNVELLNVYNVTHDEVVKYLFATDVFVLCSFMEGSANVVKEAMACNCPMVVTAAGDAAWVVSDTHGCYIADYTPADFAEKLRLALDYAAKHHKTNGRDRILELGLDASSIAQKLVNIYEGVLS